jgi:hypothetical protein
MLETISTPIAKLKPNPRNARTHSKKQLRQIADSIRQFGFVNPIIADENGVVIAGHGRLQAAAFLELNEVPVITLAGLTDAQKRTLMLADNKIAANAGWDRERLAIEIPELTPKRRLPGWSERIRTHAFPIEPGLCVSFLKFGNIRSVTARQKRFKPQKQRVKRCSRIILRSALTMEQARRSERPSAARRCARSSHVAVGPNHLKLAKCGHIQHLLRQSVFSLAFSRLRTLGLGTSMPQYLAFQL